ncbi:TPA: hypothetical protein LA742_002795 [Clostridium botulinum]|uniref:DNA ligase LigA-related protein n=1 Tax=Clostridium sporogenes TaxID=1509 RepID=UPI000774A4DF|nr:hypothetical protein [Clostridium sporogenes]HBJ2614304.1 hypothetical protein [Clostridium botulinum]
MFQQSNLFDLLYTSKNIIEEKQINKNNTHEKEIIELINKRRRQVLVHSCIYYRLNDSLIDDYTYDKWARELENLQDMYPDLLNDCIYKDDFKKYSSATGYDFKSLGDPRILNRAIKLLRFSKQNI